MYFGKSCPRAGRPLKDKYGVSWQIVPAVLGRMLQDKDALKSERIVKALLQIIPD